mmetsp:Transcript_37577/g.91340  ORF Transcript_37577/g.91340 Transcript_37577/m.91340 type:complete len:249 (+) Transcript_37577:326-1072(+)
MTWTSASIACKATSLGVWKSGPTSTSQPTSANPDEITLAPRSCPSCPILATKIRGRRPSEASNSSTLRRTEWYSSTVSSEAPELNDEPYAPWTRPPVGAYRPHWDSIASDISPSVHRAAAHSMQRLRRLLGFAPADVISPAPELSANFFNACCALASSRFSLTLFIRASCCSRTSELSIWRTSTRSLASSSALIWYLFTPTTVSFPESIRPCFIVALSSIMSLACPLLMKAVIPPFSSTCWRISFALR